LTGKRQFQDRGKKKKRLLDWEGGNRPPQRRRRLWRVQREVIHLFHEKNNNNGKRKRISLTKRNKEKRDPLHQRMVFVLGGLQAKIWEHREPKIELGEKKTRIAGKTRQKKTEAGMRGSTIPTRAMGHTFGERSLLKTNGNQQKMTQDKGTKKSASGWNPKDGLRKSRYVQEGGGPIRPESRL